MEIKNHQSRLLPFFASPLSVSSRRDESEKHCQSCKAALQRVCRPWRKWHIVNGTIEKPMENPETASKIDKNRIPLISGRSFDICFVHLPEGKGSSGYITRQFLSPLPSKMPFSYSFHPTYLWSNPRILILTTSCQPLLEVELWHSRVGPLETSIELNAYSTNNKPYIW